MRFLRELNQASNKFEDPFASAGLDIKVASGDLSLVNAALTSVVAQLEGYIKQVNELAAPADVGETGELKAATLQAASKVLKLVQALQTAIQTRNVAEITRLAPQLATLENDPAVRRPDTLQQAILAKYNIPETQVNYRRPK